MGAQESPSPPHLIIIIRFFVNFFQMEVRKINRADYNHLKQKRKEFGV
jgi:hypothetical protein